MANILSASYLKAKDFFMMQESYFTGELPPYFNFDVLLKDVDTKLAGKPISDFSEGKPRNYYDVNYKIIVNKDGNLAWRQLCLIHPALYVDLVNTICKKENWDLIKKRFAKFRANKKISCASIPMLGGKFSAKANLVLTWSSGVEKASVKQVLDFSHLFITDISDCYSSIYTHAISWALHGICVAKDNKGKGKKCLGDEIDKKIRDMSYGQSNGIPQGSVLMDFIAEMVLGYADAVLSIKLKQKNICNYHIIRYRDDYRIFTNNVQDGENIIKTLSDVLRELGLKLNTHKTFSTSDLIEKSIKREKMEYIPIIYEKNIDKLLHVYRENQKHPNAGFLKRLLVNLLDKIELEKSDDKVLLLSVIVDIAYRSPCVYPQASALISRILASMGCSNTRKEHYINKIVTKFTGKPNTGYIDIWIQRFAYKIAPDIKYREKLCGLVVGKDVSLWNNSWLKPGLARVIKCEKLINKEKMEKCSPIVPTEEVSLFQTQYQ